MLGYHLSNALAVTATEKKDFGLWQQCTFHLSLQYQTLGGFYKLILLVNRCFGWNEYCFDYDLHERFIFLLGSKVFNFDKIFLSLGPKSRFLSVLPLIGNGKLVWCYVMWCCLNPNWCVWWKVAI